MQPNDEPHSNPEPERAEERLIEHRILPSKSLYTSHFLSTWNTRGFEFGTILFLANIYPGTLLPMSIYALIRAAAAIIFSHRVGRFIDTQERLSVVRLSILSQRIAVVCSCGGFLFLLLDASERSSFSGRAVFALLVLLACVEKLCSIMNTVAIERDWVIVIADGDEALLKELNSQMRRIDLFCKLVAPLAIALLDGVSTEIALLTTLGLNCGSLSIEYPFIAKVYQKTPALAAKGTSSNTSASGDSEPLLERTASATERLKAKQHTMMATLRTYVSSPAFLPSFALSMLYLTVLSFSGQMTTFLLAIPTPKMNSITIGILRTASTIFEISATFVAPWVMAIIGPVRAGIWCLSWQLLCLTFGVIMLWAPQTDNKSPSVVLFIAAVILSRAGLWSFDLVAQLLIQNSIDSSCRGAFSSAEASVQNLFELCTFAMTIVFSSPEEFKYPAFVSLVSTYCAAILYAKFVRDHRGHLLHLPFCLKPDRRGHYEMAESTLDQG